LSSLLGVPPALKTWKTFSCLFYQKISEILKNGDYIFDLLTGICVMQKALVRGHVFAELFFQLGCGDGKRFLRSISTLHGDTAVLVRTFNKPH
jgi:hypothetical protein